jgi:hypothetical protein
MCLKVKDKNSIGCGQGAGGIELQVLPAKARDNGDVIRLLTLLFLSAPSVFSFAKLSPETAAAFDRYIELAEPRMNREFQPNEKAALRAGATPIDPGNKQEIKTPNGMIQDWVGKMFLTGATIASAKAVLQDYDNYKDYYKPDVTESKLIGHHGDEYDVFLRLYKHQILTVVLNTNYHVRYITPDPNRMQVISHSTRIAELKDSTEAPVGNDTGFLWRLNSYWRFEEADGGVYAECEAISLSRDVPLGLGFMLKGFLQKFPKESMINTLRGTKAAVARKTN